MKDLEKQIEEAAGNYCENFSHDYLWQQTNIITFKKGVKSEIAKQYWQQGMYSEEEVSNLLRDAIEYGYNLYVNKQGLGGVMINKFIEQNKKK